MHELLLQVTQLLVDIILILNCNWNITVQARTCFKLLFDNVLFALENFTVTVLIILISWPKMLRCTCIVCLQIIVFVACANNENYLHVPVNFPNLS